MAPALRKALALLGRPEARLALVAALAAASIGMLAKGKDVPTF